MVLANPSGVGAEDAFQWMLPGSGSESPAIGPGERKYTLELKVKSWSNR
jgi:hypothetical protein